MKHRSPAYWPTRILLAVGIASFAAIGLGLLAPIIPEGFSDPGAEAHRGLKLIVGWGDTVGDPAGYPPPVFEPGPSLVVNVYQEGARYYGEPVVNQQLDAGRRD